MSANSPSRPDSANSAEPVDGDACFVMDFDVTDKYMNTFVPPPLFSTDYMQHDRRSRATRASSGFSASELAQYGKQLEERQQAPQTLSQSNSQQVLSIDNSSKPGPSNPSSFDSGIGMVPEFEQYFPSDISHRAGDETVSYMCCGTLISSFDDLLNHNAHAIALESSDNVAAEGPHHRLGAGLTLLRSNPSTSPSFLEDTSLAVDSRANTNSVACIHCANVKTLHNKKVPCWRCARKQNGCQRRGTRFSSNDPNGFTNYPTPQSDRNLPAAANFHSSQFVTPPVDHTPAANASNTWNQQEIHDVRNDSDTGLAHLLSRLRCSEASNFAQEAAVASEEGFSYFPEMCAEQGIFQDETFEDVQKSLLSSTPWTSRVEEDLSGFQAQPVPVRTSITRAVELAPSQHSDECSLLSDGERSFMASEQSESTLETTMTDPDETESSVGMRLATKLVDGFRRCPAGAVRVCVGERTNSSSASASSWNPVSSQGSSQTSFSSFNPSSKRARPDEDDGSGGFRRPRRARLGSDPESKEMKLLACPFTKHDPRRYSEQNPVEKHYRGCSSSYLKDISRLKQHLYRVHRMPEHHCPCCFAEFTSKGTLDIHSRQRPACEVSPPRFEEKMTVDQMRDIKRKQSGASIPETWFNIYRILFPEASLPRTPYAEPPIPTVTLQRFLNYVEDEGPALLSELVHSEIDSTLVLDRERHIILEVAIENGISQLVQRLTPGLLQIANSQSMPMNPLTQIPESEDLSNLELQTSLPSLQEVPQDADGTELMFEIDTAQPRNPVPNMQMMSSGLQLPTPGSSSMSNYLYGEFMHQGDRAAYFDSTQFSWTTEGL